MSKTILTAPEGGAIVEVRTKGNRPITHFKMDDPAETDSFCTMVQKFWRDIGKKLDRIDDAEPMLDSKGKLIGGAHPTPNVVLQEL